MLQGKHCILRPYRQDDVLVLPSIFGDWEVIRWMSRVIPHPYTATDAESWIAKVLAESPTDNFVIEVSGIHIGGVGIGLYGGEKTGIAELSYWLRRSYWGQGIVTEAAQMLVTYAFRERRLRRLEASTFAENTASARVLEKCGFIREAVLRQGHVDRNNNIVDCLLYACLASDMEGGVKR